MCMIYVYIDHVYNLYDVYMYIYIHIHISIYMYIYIYMGVPVSFQTT